MMHNETYANVIGSADSQNEVFIAITAADRLLHTEFPVVSGGATPGRTRSNDLVKMLHDLVMTWSGILKFKPA